MKELDIPFTDPEGTYFVLADIAPYMKKGQSDVDFCVEMAQKKDETLLSALDRLSRLKQIMCG